MKQSTKLNLICVLSLFVTATIPAQVFAIELQRVFASLTLERPLLMLQSPGDEKSWYIVEQRGKIKKISNNSDTPILYADWSNAISNGSEKGLLGMAFHPQFAKNKTVFLSYTKGGSSYVTRVQERNARLDPASESIVIEVEQPYPNHNGGNIVFGPEGYLFIGFGDGGFRGDPHDHGQNVNTILGAMLRIDVDSAKPYAIPKDNPFAQGGGRPEIYAWGFRNPWRWSFDRETGQLWLADVGQDDWEEVDIVVKGGNYGWNIREGAHCYRERNCFSKDLIDPVYDYSHQLGRSITGGYVYRGSEIAEIKGAYVFGDYVSGNIWALRGKGSVYVADLILKKSGISISSFAEDHRGELFVLDLARGFVFKITADAGKQ